MGALLPVIRVGDKTSHGGTVIEGYAPGHYEVYGIPAAGLGHAVTCPVHPGIHRIAEGEASCDIRGVPIALEGMKTTCDAMLIASQRKYGRGASWKSHDCRFREFLSGQPYR